MYSWTDENGVVYFSDIKPEGQEAQSRVIPQGQAELDRLEPHRRVFFTNEKGETERVDDVERANKVAQLKAQIAKNCK